MFDDKSKWEKYHIETHSPEWFKFRTVGTQGYAGGFGASEVGKFIGRDKYEPVAPEVFYHKIGITQPREFMNDAIFWGHTLELIILNCWEFEDLEERGGYALNKSKFDKTGDEQYRIRKRGEAKYYLVNKKYPWLFCSLDSYIEPGQNMIDPRSGYWMHTEDGEIIKTQGPAPLECKAMRYYSIKQWESGMDPSYIAQVHSQMIVTESYYSEIVVLQDGRDLRIHPILLDAELAETLLETTKQVWYNQVLPGRKLFEEYKQLLIAGNRKQAEECYGAIVNLEPPVQAGQAYEDYIKKSIQENGVQVSGNMKHYKMAKSYQYAHEMMKVLDEEKSYFKNLILDEMRVKGLSVIRLGKDKKISYNTSSRRLSFAGFPVPPKSKIKRMVEKIRPLKDED
jgi:predicted phage-related endonuclease